MLSKMSEASTVTLSIVGEFGIRVSTPMTASTGVHHSNSPSPWLGRKTPHSDGWSGTGTDPDTSYHRRHRQPSDFLSLCRHSRFGPLSPCRNAFTVHTTAATATVTSRAYRSSDGSTTEEAAGRFFSPQATSANDAMASLHGNRSTLMNP